MKLLYCGYCEDIVRLFPEKRSCRCGKSWGQYLEDNATTVQTYPGLSLGMANPDFQAALKIFMNNPEHFSPALAIRCWVNPLSESDVKFVQEDDVARDAKDAGHEDNLGDRGEQSENAHQAGKQEDNS